MTVKIQIQVFMYDFAYTPSVLDVQLKSQSSETSGAMNPSPIQDPWGNGWAGTIK